MSRNCSIPPEVFLVHFSLLSPHKGSSATQCKVDQYMCVISKGSLHHVSFHAFALAEHPFTCVCFSQTFLHMFALVFRLLCTSGKHSFTCVPQQNTTQHKGLPKEPLFTFLPISTSGRHGWSLYLGTYWMMEMWGFQLGCQETTDWEMCGWGYGSAQRACQKGRRGRAAWIGS